MHALWMKKSHDVARGSDGARGRPLEFQDQHRLIAHPARSTEHGFDGGVDRLDDAEADLVIAVGGDPVEMREQELAQPLHLGQALHRRASHQPLRKVNTPLRVLYVQSRSSCSRSTYALNSRRLAAKRVCNSARLEPRNVFQRLRSNQRLPRPCSRITGPARKNS